MIFAFVAFLFIVATTFASIGYLSIIMDKNWFQWLVLSSGPGICLWP